MEEMKYIVTALTASPSGTNTDCKVRREEELYPAIYSRVFGPDTKENCESWLSENCEARS